MERKTCSVRIMSSITFLYVLREKVLTNVCMLFLAFGRFLPFSFSLTSPGCNIENGKCSTANSNHGSGFGWRSWSTRIRFSRRSSSVSAIWIPTNILQFHWLAWNSRAVLQVIRSHLSPVQTGSPKQVHIRGHRTEFPLSTGTDKTSSTNWNYLWFWTWYLISLKHF